MARYSAKLLFVWDANPATGKKSKRCLCEERIVTFSSKSADFALKKAESIGKNNERDLSGIGIKASLKYLGVMQIMEFPSYCTEDEVWYEYRYIMSPFKRKREFIPTKEIYYIYGG